MKFNKNDYLLSFLAHGISVFVTDIHVDVYKELEVLFIIDNGIFKQYFTKKAYAATLNRGLNFYSDTNAFNTYKESLKQHCKKFEKFHIENIKGKKPTSTGNRKNIFQLHNKTLQRVYVHEY
jgi:hypothetical protein